MIGRTSSEADRWDSNQKEMMEKFKLEQQAPPEDLSFSKRDASTEIEGMISKIISKGNIGDSIHWRGHVQKISSVHERIADLQTELAAQYDILATSLLSFYSTAKTTRPKKRRNSVETMNSEDNEDVLHFLLKLFGKSVLFNSDFPDGYYGKSIIFLLLKKYDLGYKQIVKAFNLLGKAKNKTNNQFLKFYEILKIYSDQLGKTIPPKIKKKYENLKKIKSLGAVPRKKKRLLIVELPNKTKIKKRIVAPFLNQKKKFEVINKERKLGKSFVYEDQNETERKMTKLFRRKRKRKPIRLRIRSQSVDNSSRRRSMYPKYQHNISSSKIIDVRINKSDNNLFRNRKINGKGRLIKSNDVLAERRELNRKNRSVQSFKRKKKFKNQRIKLEKERLEMNRKLESIKKRLKHFQEPKKKKKTLRSRRKKNIALPIKRRHSMKTKKEGKSYRKTYFSNPKKLFQPYYHVF